MDGDVKAIELQGIVRNKTKLNVEDGQAEDLLNLRFMDGSWRTSGDGRNVYMMSNNANGYNYTQIYVHTNTYRHLLGVRDGKLYWFADIATDGVTFTPKATPQELTSVTGDLWIMQTGHLLTVIDEADNFEYLIFKTTDGEMYQKVQTHDISDPSKRNLFPFGGIHFNFECGLAGNTQHLSGDRIMSGAGWLDDEYNLNMSIMNTVFTPENFHNYMIKAFNENCQKHNRFTRPFLVVACIKDYAGEYHYASNPVLIYPGEKTGRMSMVNGCRFKNNIYTLGQYYKDDNDNNILESESTLFTTPWSDGDTHKASDYFNIPYCPLSFPQYYLDHNTYTTHLWDLYVGGSYGNDGSTPNVFRDVMSPVFAAGAFISGMETSHDDNGRIHYSVTGNNLTISIDETFVEFMMRNKTTFSALSIFITPEVDIFDMSVNGNLGSVHYRWLSSTVAVCCYKPYVRKYDDVIDELMNSSFYLFREYNVAELPNLLKNPRVDVDSSIYQGLLTNIVQQPILTTEAFGRTTFLPKYMYTYNGRLHFANYKAFPYLGYPLDAFLLHNNKIEVVSGEKFLEVLPNIRNKYNEYWQNSANTRYFLSKNTTLDNVIISNMRDTKSVFMQIIVEYETADGIQRVSTYIDTYNINDGLGAIRGPLNMLSYPDARATKMIFRVMCYEASEWEIRVYEDEYQLTPHKIYNFAYYLPPFGKVIVSTNVIDYMDDSKYKLGDLTLKNELQDCKNAEEYFPNGLKVSKTDDPMFFPVENTYQVGGGQILAMCSNTIAVGTGQTGAVPLYIFCTDGIYALFVDASGEMAYTNARVLARDVLNNPHSVTPIDEGVVFTTDRGLMMIAGEQVREIGQSAEGDVLQYADPDNPDHIKIAGGALEYVADFPNSICDKTDFLTYLTGAIVNYNHNQRELIISNPAKDYSYILDRNGNWARRDYSADEYIQNYPTSYRLRNGEFYKVDEEGDDNTPLEEKKEADNKFFYLSNIIKLGTISFKQAARFVVRGYFNSAEYWTRHPQNNRPYLAPTPIGCYIFGSYDGRKWAMLGGNEKAGTFTDIGCKIERTDVRFFRICLAGRLKGDSRIDYMEISSEPSMLNSKIR